MANDMELIVEVAETASSQSKRRERRRVMAWIHYHSKHFRPGTNYCCRGFVERLISSIHSDQQPPAR
jgi:hypothetical protein